SWLVVHSYLHSFPTRRSSDLKIAFQSFSEITFALPKKNIFSGLLRNRASTSFSSLSLILLICLFYRFPVKTIMGTKMSVFAGYRSEEHTSELQSRENLVCRLL